MQKPFIRPWTMVKQLYKFNSLKELVTSDDHDVGIQDKNRRTAMFKMHPNHILKSRPINMFDGKS